MKPLLDQFAADGSFWKTTEPLALRVVESEDIERFNELLARKHYLGETPPVGDFLRQVVVRDGKWWCGIMTPLSIAEAKAKLPLDKLMRDYRRVV